MVSMIKGGETVSFAALILMARRTRRLFQVKRLAVNCFSIAGFVNAEVQKGVNSYAGDGEGFLIDRAVRSCGRTARRLIDRIVGFGDTGAGTGAVARIGCFERDCDRFESVVHEAGSGCGSDRVVANRAVFLRKALLPPGGLSLVVPAAHV